MLHKFPFSKNFIYIVIQHRICVNGECEPKCFRLVYVWWHPLKRQYWWPSKRSTSRWWRWFSIIDGWDWHRGTINLLLWFNVFFNNKFFPIIQEGDHDEPNDNLKSKVWKYFAVDGASKVKATCKLCEKLVDRSGGSTTNMIRHLRNVHKKDPGCATGKSISNNFFCSFQLVINNLIFRIFGAKKATTCFYQRKSPLRPSLCHYGVCRLPAFQHEWQRGFSQLHTCIG